MKKIWKKIKLWFRRKPVKVVTRSEAIAEKLPLHYRTALTYLGTAEVAGKKHNSVIVDMFRLVTGKAYSDETAWCAAFVGNCLAKAGLRHTGKLNARSYLTKGVAVDKPQVGDVVIFWRGSKGGWKGHVGFYAGETAGFIKVLGGNQSNKVSIANYPKHRLLGYRRYL